MKPIKVLLVALIGAASLSHASDKSFSNFHKCAMQAIENGAQSAAAVNDTCAEEWAAFTKDMSPDEIAKYNALTEQAIQAGN